MTATVNETQSNEVDWSKNPQLVEYLGSEDNRYIVLFIGENRKDEKLFKGVVEFSNLQDIKRGEYKKTFIKKCFKPFHGSITLSND